MTPTDYDLLPPEFQRLLDEWQADDAARLEKFAARARSLDPLFDRRPGHNFDNPNMHNMLGVPGFHDPWYLSLAELPRPL